MTTRHALDAAFYVLVTLVLALVLWMHAHHTPPSAPAHPVNSLGEVNI